MTDWLKVVERCIIREMADCQSQRIIVACSSGVDSMVLLDIVQNLAKYQNWEIAVAYLDHGLRPNSNRDLKIIREFAEQKNITIFEKKIDVKMLVAEAGTGIEETGRVQRYNFFSKCLKLFSADLLMTAHHKDDQNETVLMNLVRGSGIRGLAGIPKHRGQIFRPLLCVEKREILEYAAQKEIPFQEDETNVGNQFLRNRVRNKLLPKMKEIFRRKIDFYQTSEHFRKTADFLAFHADRLLNKMNQSENKNEFLLILEDWNALHQMEQFWIVSHIFKTKGLRMGENNFIQLLDFVCSESPKRLRFSNIEISIYGDYLRFLQPEVKTEIHKKINLGKSIKTQRFSFLLDTAEKPTKWNNDPNEEYIDLIKLKGDELLLRQWQKGDRIRPLGMKGTKTIGNLLTDYKIDPILRKHTPVLTNKNQIIWLCGYCLNDNYKLNKFTQKTGRLTIQYYDR